MTTLVNVKRTRRFDVYIGRAGLGYDKYPGGDGYFGNPHRLSDFGGDRSACLAAYRKYLHERLHVDPEFKERVLELDGLTLGCFCWPDECHGEVIIEWLEANAPRCGICGNTYGCCDCAKTGRR